MQQLDDAEAFAIPPGQFAFLLTEESVTVPPDAIAFISIRAKLKFNGLIDISGFHVDPGYQGKLLFSVLNAGPKPIHLRQNQPVFLMWYADLDKTTERRKNAIGLQRIESSIVNRISGEILSLQSLSQKINDLQRETSWRNKRTLFLFSAVVGLLVKEFWPVFIEFLADLF